MTVDDQKKHVRGRIFVGARAQIAGAIAVTIGILLRVWGPQPAPEVPINPHQFAYVIVVMGICAIIGGTLARFFTHGKSN
jgi:hypothetical protein